ncbi:ParB/RepB/Spo0J family partition protein [Streptomyces sp. NPDC058286]|uniref:ParB/RepB/Spo0J family partition protein n=1 Tax=Streptomyces sp. NPDC058286 TaxID=3346422 RepID=UPI0036EF93B2
MSKRDQLGAGRFGGGSTTGVSARRAAMAQATGVATTGAPDSRLKTLPLEQLVPTRFNPRRNFGTDDDLKDFGLKLKTKQLQPAVAVTREAYLKLWEDEATAVGTHRYVIANGERRFRASQIAGLDTLEVIVDDTIAESRAVFLDAVLSENNDREDLNPVEQAIGIQTMVEQLGGKSKVAEHYGKSPGWVTQQLYLLKLAPELQGLVSAGVLPVRETRDLVKLPVEEQATAWENRLAAREVEKEDKQELRRTSPSSHSGFTAVKPKPSDAPATGGVDEEAPAGFTAVKPARSVADQASSEEVAGQDATPEGADQPQGDAGSDAGETSEPKASSAEGVPEPRQSVVEKQPALKKFPYDDGVEAAFYLNRKMDDVQFFKLVEEVMKMAQRRRERATTN